MANTLSFRTSIELRKDPGTVLKLVCRGIIRRVVSEHPNCSEDELRRLVDLASPFQEQDPLLERIWREETEAAMRHLQQSVQC